MIRSRQPLRSRSLSGALLAGIAGVAVVAVGCGEAKPDLVASASASASASAGPMGMSSKLARAVKSAEAAGEKKTQPGAAPPPSGIFAPGEADKLMAAGAATTISVIDDGKEPRLLLKRKAPTENQKIPLHISLSNGNQPMLAPLMLTLSVGPEKGKVEAGEAKDKEKDKGDKDKKPAPKPASSAQPSASASAGAPSEAPPGGARVYVTVVDATAEGGNDRVPKAVGDQIGKLKGASISFTFADGALTDAHRETANNDPAADMLLRAVEEALMTLYMPAPDKPIGEGGYFMVTDRRMSLGVEVLRYRVFKVTKVNGDVASLSLDEKQYAVAPKLDLPQAAEQLAKVTLTEYLGAGKGVLDVAPNSLFPKGSVMQVQSQASFMAGGGGDKGQKAALGFQVQALLGDIPTSVNTQGPPGGGDELEGPN